MAKGNFARRKEKKKPKKSPKSKRNGKITTSRALYDNQLVNMPSIPVSRGY